MRVLVTGATGLIGSEVCDALLARGDEVVGLSRNAEKRACDEPDRHLARVEPDRGAPAARGLRAESTRSSTCVGEQINQRWNDEVKRKIRESRGRATKNLVDGIAAAEPRPRVLVSQSAVGVYGDRGDALLDESKTPGERLPGRRGHRVGGCRPGRARSPACAWR